MFRIQMLGQQRIVRRYCVRIAVYRGVLQEETRVHDRGHFMTVGIFVPRCGK